MSRGWQPATLPRDVNGGLASRHVVGAPQDGLDAARPYDARAAPTPTQAAIGFLIVAGFFVFPLTKLGLRLVGQQPRVSPDSPV